MFDTAYQNVLAFLGAVAVIAFVCDLTTGMVVPAPVLRLAYASIAVATFTALFYERDTAA